MFAVRRLIAQNVRIGGQAVNLDRVAKKAAKKLQEACSKKAESVCLTMAIDEHMEPEWSSIKAWVWEHGKAPEHLEKTTQEVKSFVKDRVSYDKQMILR